LLDGRGLFGKGRACRFLRSALGTFSLCAGLSEDWRRRGTEKKQKAC
jgi:hypothetical protein